MEGVLYKFYNVVFIYTKHKAVIFYSPLYFEFEYLFSRSWACLPMSKKRKHLDPANSLKDSEQV